MGARMKPFASALYVGRVMHQRLRPRRHKFGYRGFWFVFDLDEIDALARRLSLFSHNRFNLFSFHDRDYGDRTGAPLRPQIERHMAAAELAPDGGAIRLLTLPRVFGYVFNPLSVFFIHGADGGLRAILWEVSNTFGERHAYLIPVADRDSRAIRQSCSKRLHVSPFLDMDMTYHFRVAPPAARTLISIVAADAEGALLVAAMGGGRRELGDGALLRAFVRVPLMTLKVIGAIHWEALRLWLKGMVPRSSPPPPRSPVTVAPIAQQIPSPALCAGRWPEGPDEGRRNFYAPHPDPLPQGPERGF
jgi:DUF1365 family protein